MIKDYTNFVDESYLDSNHAPLYHFTSIWSLINIFKFNSLSLGHYDHSFSGNIKKIVSLTRDKNFNIGYKEFEVKIYLDKDKLTNNYKTNPYDFFSSKGDKKKWEIDRINPFESEEVIIYDIKDLNRYILYLDFFDIDFIYPYLNEIKTYINKYNIECRIKEKIIDIDGI
jgi:hypothetical protein